MADPLFSCRNLFYLGAYQSAISEASNLTGLSEAEKIERDVFVYRSYIELGTYEVCDCTAEPCRALCV
jgi:coatomer protein complex subunit epsilon